MIDAVPGFCTGGGVLVPLICLDVLMVAGTLGDWLFPHAAPGPLSPTNVMMASSLGGAGIVFWALGRFLHSQPPRLLVDCKTGEEFEYRAEHKFFFVPIEYWSIPAAGLGALSLLVQAISSVVAD